MKIKILGDKAIRDSGMSIFNIKNRVFKIPVRLTAYKELLAERKNLEEAKKDQDFLNHILEYKYYFGIQQTPLLTPLKQHVKSNELIKAYFSLAFKNALQWNFIELKNLEPLNHYLDFISRYVPSDYNFWTNYLTKTIILKSSAHGDFYPDNILVRGDKLYFIDWTRYNLNSSRYFDLIDYYIFSEKEKNKSWIDFWKEQKFNIKNKILNVDIRKEYFIAYALWKISEELKTLKFRKNLNKYKIKKYINFIKLITKEI